MKCFSCNAEVLPKVDSDSENCFYRCQKCDKVFSYPYFIRTESGDAVSYERPHIGEENFSVNLAHALNKEYVAGVVGLFTLVSFIFFSTGVVREGLGFSLIFVSVSAIIFISRLSLFEINKKIIVTNEKIIFEPIGKKFKKVLRQSFYIQNIHKIVIYNEQIKEGDRVYPDYKKFRVLLLLLNGKKIDILSMNRNLFAVVSFLESLEKDLGIGRVVSHEYRTSSSDEYWW